MEHDPAAIASGFSKACNHQHPHEPGSLVVETLEKVYEARDGEDGNEGSIGTQRWIIAIDGGRDWTSWPNLHTID